ncbi:cupin domain-containing protein [Methanogenium marinum]|uniref:Cupin domain-containing protein n=1 Tax=Methanogenium marinum TaxID=348610 RepID=A0A9Q4KTL8_9EURY|nr:cupin domain-containing protein [Methanogenium marinum]MDE4908582.1 cupin domain-containing protein [Methanogenium marinum]
MERTQIVKQFDEGTIISPQTEIQSGSLEWYEHPAFKGVYLKDLIPGSDTNGQFSCHIVRIEKGCEVGDHSHETQWEFNESLQGNGVFVLGGKRIPFGSNYSFVTPPGVEHTVIAEDEDLYILAKFIPAL